MFKSNLNHFNGNNRSERYFQTNQMRNSSVDVFSKLNQKSKTTMSSTCKQNQQLNSRHEEDNNAKITQNITPDQQLKTLFNSEHEAFSKQQQDIHVESVESLDPATRESIIKIKSDLKNHLAHANHLLMNNEKAQAGIYLMNVMKNFKMEPNHAVYVLDELLPLLEKVIKSMVQAWHFDTSEWREQLKEKHFEISHTLAEMIKKKHPSLFNVDDNSTSTDIERNTTEFKVNFSGEFETHSTSIDSSHFLVVVMIDKVVNSIIMNMKPWSDYISHSILVQFDIQKHLLLFFGEAIKEKNETNIPLNISVFAGYCYSVLFNEHVMMSDDMSEKTMLLRMWKHVQQKYDDMLKQQQSTITTTKPLIHHRRDTSTVLDVSTDIPIHVKSCMNLCRIIFNFNPRNEQSYTITESQLTELLKTDPHNPYILYFHCLVLEKKAKFLMMQDFDKNVYQVENALQSELSLIEKLENILKEHSPPQTRKDQLPYLTSGFTPFLPTPLRKAHIYSMQIDLFSRSQLTPKIQSSVNQLLMELGKLEKLLFPKNPLLLTNNMLNQFLFLKARAYFYARNATSCCETFETLFSLRYLFEEHEPNVVKAASFYVAGMHMLKRLQEATPKLEQLLKEDPSNLELQFLRLSIRELSLQNTYISRNDFTSLIHDYQELLKQVQDKTTKSGKSSNQSSDSGRTNKNNKQDSSVNNDIPKVSHTALEQKILNRLQYLYQVSQNRKGNATTL